jgi:hypothetical protein
MTRANTIGAPLIRAPQGTEIRASLHNILDVPICVHGLVEPGSDLAVRIAPRNGAEG